MWDLRLKNRHWDRFSSRYFRFPPSAHQCSIFIQTSHTEAIKYNNWKFNLVALKKLWPRRYTLLNLLHGRALSTHLSSVSSLQFILTKQPSDLLPVKCACDIQDCWWHLWTSGLNGNWMGLGNKTQNMRIFSKKQRLCHVCYIYGLCEKNLYKINTTVSVYVTPCSLAHIYGVTLHRYYNFKYCGLIAILTENSFIASEIAQSIQWVS